MTRTCGILRVRSKVKVAEEEGEKMRLVALHETLHAETDHALTTVALDEWMDEWMNGWMDEWTSEWMDEWMDGRVDEWMDG